MLFEDSKCDVNAKNLSFAFTIGNLADSFKNLKISLSKQTNLYCTKSKNDVYAKQIFYANMKFDVGFFSSR